MKATMANIKIFLVILITLLFGCRDGEIDTKSTSVKNVYYTCSMDPQIRELHPGKCPICKMELTKVEILKNDLNQITLSKKQIYLGNISSEIISESSHFLSDKFSGQINNNQNSINMISARAMGRIQHVYFKSVGEFIDMNAPVYDLYSEEIAIAKNDYFAAYSSYKSNRNTSVNFKTLMQSARQKLEYFGLNSKQIQDIIIRKDLSPITTFYSKNSGTIKEILKRDGDFVMEGENIYTVLDLKTIWFEAEINSIYFDKVNINLPVTINFIEYPNLKFEGKTSFINPELASNNRNFLLRVEIANPDFKLIPGMQGEMELSHKKLTGIFIPYDAVIREQNSSSVWIEVYNGVFENVMVNTGSELGDGLVEIISGLKVGQRIVTRGAYSINSEYKFKRGADPMDGMKM